MCSILKRDLNLISPSQLLNSLILDRNTQWKNNLNKRISIYTGNNEKLTLLEGRERKSRIQTSGKPNYRK
jgi:hypothetical protein